MTTLVATFHVGSGSGFHQVIELNGGIVNYANLKRDSDGARLAGGSNTDPVFSGGWGVGYGFDDRTQLEFVPEYGIAIHERSGLSNRVSNTNRMQSLKLTFRMGLGARSLGR
jgi:predicted sulfurtransferase